MSQETIDSLCEFLLHAKTDFRIFDVGRVIQPISTQAFLELENGQQPAPFPRQNSVWFAIAFWQANNALSMSANQPYIWFLRFDIDEQGKIVAATRNHFLQLIVESLQRDPSLREGLPNNPYVFTPNENLRAQLSAKIKQLLGINTSAAVKQISQYINAPGAYDWRTLSKQDVFDAANALINEPQLLQRLISNWSQLANEFIESLLIACENIDLPTEFESFILTLFNSPPYTEHSLRALQALTSSSANPMVLAKLFEILNSAEAADINVLSVIAGRFGHQLSPALLRLFFQRCEALEKANEENQAVVTGFYQDLVRIPAIRSHMIRA